MVAEKMRSLAVRSVRGPGASLIPQVSLPAGDSTDFDMILSLFQQQDNITMHPVFEGTGWARATAGGHLKKQMDAGRIIKVSVER